MNETIALNKLASLLAKKADLTEAEAEKFIRLYFSQIENALTVSGDVTINGLGRFVRQTDIDTPLSFEIDPQLAAEINRPFDMFEAVRLPKGFNISDLDAFSEKNENLDNKTDDENISEIKQEAESKIVTVSSPVFDDIETPITDNKVDAVSDTQIEEFQEEDTESEQETFSEPEIIAPVVSSKNNLWRYAAVAIIAMLLGFGIGFIAFKSILRHQTEVDVLTEANIEPIVSDTLSNIDDFNTDDINITEITDTTIITPPVIYDVISTNRFLTTMAREYYGQMEFWAFIYKANEDSLGHPNRIAPGTRVVIPSKDDFIIPGETYEQTVERAKNLGTEIYSRYEF